jgi:23S rRNA pseudouridine1911/1915/1917 synthase
VKRSKTPGRVFAPDTPDVGKRLDLYLVEQLPDLSRSAIQRLIAEGHVTVSHGKVKASLPVEAGLEIHLEIPPPTDPSPQAQNLPLTVLHDDDDVVVVDKAAGIVVHPAAGHASGTLVNALLHHVRGLSGIGGTARPGIVHRLDRGTSGVLLVAKHDRAHRALAKQFSDRTVGKEYVALVWGRPKTGESIDLPIGRHPRNRKKMSSRGPRTRQATTRIERVEPLGGVSLVTLTIGTGRTHQIRVHLSEIGHAVVGDDLYGGIRHGLPGRVRVLETLTRPFLHAARLTFVHPSTGETMTVAAPLAPDLQAIVATLRASMPKARVE